MGRGRYGGRVTERLDAATGFGVQRDWREGAGGVEVGQASAVVLGVGADALAERQRFLSLYAGDQSALRVEGIAADAARGGVAECVCAAPASGRGDAARGEC